MKHRPELNDDFISSAGVPTIPLNTTKKRTFTNTIVYAVIALFILVVMFAGYELVYGLLSGFIALYFGVGVVVSIVMTLLGVVIKNKWLFLMGLLCTALSIGLVLSDISFGLSIAVAMMIALFVYRWYIEKYHYDAIGWPIFAGLIALVFGLLLIVMQLQIIAAVIIAPVLLVVTGAMIVWDLWRTLWR